MSEPQGTDVRGRRGMGGHHKPIGGETVEWYTPPGIFDALGLEFDLDPCAPPGGVPWIPSRRSLSVDDDGLVQAWDGLVWMNPPYGPETAAWMRRLAAHGEGVALVFARTETRWFHETIPTASAVCFIAGRLTFIASDGSAASSNSGAPSMLVGYGEACSEAVERCGLGLVFRPGANQLHGQATLWEAA